MLHRSGFYCLSGTVNQGIYQFYSDESWNPEKADKDHVAIFKTRDGNVIVGMEDLYNETLLSDKDCNDIIFHVSSYPEKAILVNTEIPDAPESDYVEEEVDVVQPLSSIIDVEEGDEFLNDLYVASASKLQVVDGFVTGVQDILYIAKSETMSQLSETIYVQDEKARKVVVRTTIKVPQARVAADEKKGRTVVRTTIKNTDWKSDLSRSIFDKWSSVDAMILAQVEEYREALQEGEVLKVEVVLEFEGVEYEEFVSSINVPPYSPFIVDAE